MNIKSLKVRDLMTDKVVTVKPKDTLSHLQETMDRLDVRHMPIVDDEGDLIGIVSQRDLIAKALVDPALPISVHQDILRKTRAEDIMVEDVVTVEPEEAAQKAARVMFLNKYGCLPVVDGQRLVGILTEADFVRFFTGE